MILHNQTNKQTKKKQITKIIKTIPLPSQSIRHELLFGVELKDSNFLLSPCENGLMLLSRVVHSVSLSLTINTMKIFSKLPL